jgi:hypothetical protein
MRFGGVGQDVYRMSQELIGHRVKAGSMTRDLIYHLVCLLLQKIS